MVQNKNAFISEKDLLFQNSWLWYRRKQIQEKLNIIKNCSSIVNIWYFGFYEYKEVTEKKLTIPRSLDINYIILNTIENLKASNFKLARLSIMDIAYGKIWDHEISPKTGILVSEETIKDYYKQEKRLKISLNDQLDNFYESCNNNTITDEFSYYFHTKRLNSVELKDSQRKFHHFSKSQMKIVDGIRVPRRTPSFVSFQTIKHRDENKENDVLILEDNYLALQNPFDKMTDNEFLLYMCFRATFTITPESAILLKEFQLDAILEFLTPYLYIAIWRSSRTMDKLILPNSKLSMKIIGLDNLFVSQNAFEKTESHFKRSHSLQVCLNKHFWVKT